MPIRKVQFVNGAFYHIIKRGVEERRIFLDKEDHFRFVNSLLVFNDKKPTSWKIRAFWDQRDPTSLMGYRPEDPLVEIHAFVLMENHFHLLVRQLTEKGVVNFMHKLGGYSYYFNKKYERVGPLFQGRYRIIRIKIESQLKNNFVYIKTNPVAIIEPGWREWKVREPQKVIQFLEREYRWSSYWDYIGKENFSSVITREFFLNLFGGEKEIRKEVESWVSFKTDLDILNRTALE